MFDVDTKIIENVLDRSLWRKDMFKKSLLKGVVSLIVLASVFNLPALSLSECKAESEISGNVEMDEQQKNAINMLNYVRALVQEINDSSNNSIYLEELYSALLNNTHPNAVDQETLDEVLRLLDDLEGYRMISVKRERLQYYYEQNKAQAMREAIPNPLGLLSAVNSYSKTKLITSLVYMAVDSVANYQTASSQAEIEKLQEGRSLDEEGAKILHNSQKSLFSYMINIVDMYGLDGNLALNDDLVKEYVSMKNEANVARKITFFEDNEKKYQAFGPYWLTLAECYYEKGEYAKCLEAINSYQALNVNIFREDHKLAQVLPLAIISADEELVGVNHLEKVEEYCELILENTSTNNWDLRYFVAQTYIDLFARTEDYGFLEKAYNIAHENVNILVEEQLELNKQYLAEIREEKVPEGASKEQKKEINSYNKQRKEARKTELIPIYEPLILNCDLLFSLVEELAKTDDEKAEINSILHDNEGELFLIPELDSWYSFEDAGEESEIVYEIAFNGKELVIPAVCVYENSEIKVKIVGADTVEYTDWVVKEVERGKNNDLAEFKVTYVSDSAKEAEYAGNECVTVKVITKSGMELEPIEASFNVIRDKRVSVLDNWDWLDEASDWSDVISFERES